MTEAAVALTKRGADGKVEQLGIAQQSIWRLALNSNGTDLFDDFRRPKKSRLDEPAADRRPGVRRRTWRTSTAPAGSSPRPTDLGGNDLNAYKQGRVAMLVRWGSAHQMEQVAGATSAVPWPKGPADRGAAVADLTTEAVGIMRDAARRQDAGWLFCRWYQKDWQSAVLRDPANPTAARVASRSDLQDVARAALPAPQDVWFELAKIGVARPVFPDWARSTPRSSAPTSTPSSGRAGAARGGDGRRQAAQRLLRRQPAVSRRRGGRGGRTGQPAARTPAPPSPGTSPRTGAPRAIRPA